MGFLQEKVSTHYQNERKWVEANRHLTRISMVQRAIESVKPYGDHLEKWLIEEVMELKYVDQEWVNGVLKWALEEQYPTMRIQYLDQRLPTKIME